MADYCSILFFASIFFLVFLLSRTHGLRSLYYLRVKIWLRRSSLLRNLSCVGKKREKRKFWPYENMFTKNNHCLKPYFHLSLKPYFHWWCQHKHSPHTRTHQLVEVSIFCILVPRASVTPEDSGRQMDKTVLSPRMLYVFMLALQAETRLSHRFRSVRYWANHIVICESCYPAWWQSSTSEITVFAVLTTARVCNCKSLVSYIYFNGSTCS